MITKKQYSEILDTLEKYLKLQENNKIVTYYNEDREELLKTVNFMENSDIKNTKLQHFTTYLQNEIKNMDMEEKYGMTQIVSDYKKMKYDFYNRIDFVLKNTDKILDISEKFMEEEIEKFKDINYAKDKIFIGLTAVLLALVTAVLFFPRFKGEDGGSIFAGESETPVLAVIDNTEDGGIAEFLPSAMPPASSYRCP